MAERHLADLEAMLDDPDLLRFSRPFHVKQGVREDTEIWSRLASDPA